MTISTAMRKARGAGVSDDTRVAFAALVTIAVGIWIDTRGLWFSQPMVDLGTWAVLFWILARATADERTQLVLCLLIATLGEYFLGFVWGLYEYRLGNLPLFIPAATGDFGNTGRNILYGPGQKDVDIALVKFFPVTDTSGFEFRSEFFNAFNNVNFANPINLLANANVGAIVATTTGPRVVQFALKYSF